MARARKEQTQQARLDALDTAYKAALYATPRDEAVCLRLAEAMLSLCRGTRLEASAMRTVQRHQGKVVASETAPPMP